MRFHTLALAAALVAAAAPAADAQRREAVILEWREPMEAGARLHLHNVNGGIRVEPGSGDRAELTAIKHYRDGREGTVRVVARRINGGRDAIVCALYTESARCDEDGYHGGRSRWNRDNEDVSVEYVVRLPRGVHLDANTVNGGIEIADVTGEVDAHTVNGSITAASLAGPVRANTVNGSIRARMGSVGDADLRYKAVNGSITIEVPDDFAGRISTRTVNGSFESDFPITIQGRFNPRRIEAQLGEGGGRLEAETVNGNVRLLKRG